MVVDGGWRVWASFCRREDAIYTEWKAAAGSFQILCICNHRVINSWRDVRILGLRLESRPLPRSIRTE